MKLKISEARKRLGEVVLHVQNPNECAVMTRHGVPVAAVVSMDNLRRIWQIEDEEERGEMKHPLNKNMHVAGSPFARLVPGLRGAMVTRKEAALQVRTLQLTRAEERRILEAGGLEEVEGGELRLENDPGDRFRSERAEPRGRWRFWRRS